MPAAESASTSAAAALPRIAILATPDTTASVVHGLYDLFRCVGRDWPMVVSGEPGVPLLDPVIVERARRHGDGGQRGADPCAPGAVATARRRRWPACRS